MPCCDGFTSPRSDVPPAAFAMAWASSNGIHAVEVGPKPFHDLVEAARFAAALGGAQGGIGDEQDAAVHLNVGALAKARERHDVGGSAA